MAQIDENTRDGFEVFLPRLKERTGSDDWVEFRPALHCRDSTVHFVKSSTFRLPELAVKVFPHGRSFRKKTIKLRGIQKIGHFFHKACTEEYRVPEPVMLLKGSRALVMEYINAPMSSKLLLKASLSGSTQDQIISKSAAWLRWFHDQSKTRPQPFDASLVTQKFQRIVRRTAEMTGAESQDRFVLDCVKVAERIARRMNEMRVPHGRVHGDFTPHNLFLNGNVITGIDFQECTRLPLVQDISRYMMYADFARGLPPSVKDVKKYGCQARNFETFMEAYGVDKLAVDERTWLEFQFLEISRRIISLEMLKARGRSRPLRIIEMAFLRRKAKVMLEVLR